MGKDPRKGERARTCLGGPDGEPRQSRADQGESVAWRAASSSGAAEEAPQAPRLRDAAQLRSRRLGGGRHGLRRGCSELSAGTSGRQGHTRHPRHSPSYRAHSLAEGGRRGGLHRRRRRQEVASAAACESGAVERKASCSFRGGRTDRFLAVPQPIEHQADHAREEIRLGQCLGVVLAQQAQNLQTANA
eukprot:scaffold922_cov327-Pinguiococcus_pyrenoidosus.AAC.7